MKDPQLAAMSSALGTGQEWLAGPRVAWVRWSIGALLLLLLLSLAVEAWLPAEAVKGNPVPMKALAWTRATLAAVLGLLLVAWLLISQRVHRESQSRARLWEESIESMKVGVALYDADDRLIGCNAAYRNLYSEIADRLVPGRTYRELMTAYYDVAPPEVVDGRSLEDFIADGERRRRSGSEVSEVVRHHRGRWLLMTDCRTVSGGIICFRNDVTEQKVIEHELSKRRKLIDDLADLTYDWFWRQDADGRLRRVLGGDGAARQGAAAAAARKAARGHARLRGRSQPVRRVPRAHRAAQALSLVRVPGAAR